MIIYLSYYNKQRNPSGLIQWKVFLDHIQVKAGQGRPSSTRTWGCITLPPRDATMAACGLPGCWSRESERRGTMLALNDLRPERTHHTSVLWPELVPRLHPNCDRDQLTIRKLVEYLMCTNSAVTAYLHIILAWVLYLEGSFSRAPIITSQHSFSLFGGLGNILLWFSNEVTG